MPAKRKLQSDVGVGANSRKRITTSKPSAQSVAARTETVAGERRRADDERAVSVEQDTVDEASEDEEVNELNGAGPNDWRTNMSTDAVDRLESAIRSAPSYTPATVDCMAKLILPIDTRDTDADDTSDFANIRLRAIMAAHRVFADAVRRGQLLRTEMNAETKTATDQSALIQQQYTRYKDAAISAIRYSTTNALVIAAIQSLMHFVTSQHEREYVRQSKSISILLSSPQSLYSRVVEALVLSPNFNDNVLTHVITNYAQIYDDLRYAALKCIARLIKHKQQKQQDGTQHIVESADINQQASPLPTENILSMLLRLTELTVAASSSTHEPHDYVNAVDNNNNGDLSKANKKANGVHHYNNKEAKQFISAVWLSFLSLSNLPLSVYKRVLMSMSTVIIPAMALATAAPNANIKTISSTSPSSIWLLSDFLVDGYSYGGLLSILALDGLFILITRYGLDYPHYYRHLYALCTDELTLATYRARFFQLLNLSLMSSFIPMSVLTSFIKRLARLALTAPAPAALSLLAIIHTAMRRHPSTKPLIDRPIKKKSQQQDGKDTPLEDQTSDEAETTEAAAKEHDLTEFIRQRQRDLLQAEAEAVQKQKPQKRKRNTKEDVDADGNNDGDERNQVRIETDKNQTNGHTNGRVNESSKLANSRCAVDPFDAKSSDPSSTNAHLSSLWEVDTLRFHFVPQVAAVAEHILTSLQAPLPQPIDSYLNATYNELFDKEIHRRENQHVALADDIVTAVFPEHNQTTLNDEEDEENHHFKWTSLHKNWTW